MHLLAIYRHATARFTVAIALTKPSRILSVIAVKVLKAIGRITVQVNFTVSTIAVMVLVQAAPHIVVIDALSV